MALDTQQDRMSAMNVACPWRGPLVDATEAGFNVGNRQAGAFFYSGISSGAAPVAITVSNHAAIVLAQRRSRVPPTRLRARIHRRPH